MTSCNYHVITPATTSSYVHAGHDLWNQGGMGCGYEADFDRMVKLVGKVKK